MSKKSAVLNNIKYLIAGIVIGIGGILPGISGGVLCVIFGIYEVLMETLAHPLKNGIKNIKIMIPIGVGIIIGFIGFANIVNILLQKYESYTYITFLGLTIGMIPSTYKNVVKNGSTNKNKILLIASSIISMILFIIFKKSKIVLPLNIFSYFLCGIAWGISIIIPGLSSSILIMFLGLYQPMTEGIAILDIKVILPVILGIAFIIIIFSKLIDYLFKKHYANFYHIILGVIISSIVLTFPTNFKNSIDLIIQIIFLIIGFVISFCFDNILNKE